MMRRKEQLPFYWLMVLVFFGLLPLAFSGDYARGLLVQFMIFTTLAVGMNVVFGYMGHIPFGYAVFWGLGAYISGLLAVKLGWPFWMTFGLALALSTLAGVFIGWVCLRLHGAYFAISTLGFMAIFHVICKNWISLTRGPMGVYGIPRPFIFGLRLDTNLSYYFLCFGVLLFCLYFADRLDRSPIGRATAATRENEELAKSVGISVFRFQLVSFCVAAAMASMAGSLYAHYFSSINPDLFTSYYSLAPLVMVVVGGRGTLFGPVVGAVIFVILPEYFGLTGKWRLLLFGIVTLIFIIGLPKGVWPALSGLGQRVKATEFFEKQTKFIFRR
jgi:branched-chain amino acid transport system permease protein